LNEEAFKVIKFILGLFIGGSAGFITASLLSANKFITEEE